MKRYLRNMLWFCCQCLNSIPSPSPLSTSCLAGRYMVSGNHCYRDGERRTTTRWSSPYARSFYYSSRKSTSGIYTNSSHFLWSCVELFIMTTEFLTSWGFVFCSWMSIFPALWKSLFHFVWRRYLLRWDSMSQSTTLPTECFLVEDWKGMLLLSQ